MDTHTIGFEQSRVVHNDIIQSFLFVAQRETVVYFGTQEEIISAELCTEHYRHTDLEHVSRLGQFVKQIIVRRAVGQILAFCLETIGGC